MRHVAQITLMAVVAASLAVGGLEVERSFLADRVSGVDGTIDRWLDTFEYWAVRGIGLAFVLSVIWYVAGQWWLYVDNWLSANRRLAWWLLFAVVALSLVVVYQFLPRPLGGAWLAYTIYLLDVVLCFYICTALFSPSAYKYTAPGAKALRRYW